MTKKYTLTEDHLVRMLRRYEYLKAHLTKEHETAEFKTHHYMRLLFDELDEMATDIKAHFDCPTTTEH